ncbi:MAG: Fic family protein [Lachnospiraceae bacterium]
MVTAEWQDCSITAILAKWKPVFEYIPYTSYLHPAIELNLIGMTIPDKPNSRNQPYIKK